MKAETIFQFFILIFTIFTLQWSEATADDALRPPVDLETLALDEAVSIALENSYTLRESEDELKRIKNRRGEETLWNWLRPNVSLRGGWNTEENVPDVSVGASVDLRDIMGAGKKRISNLELDMRLAEAKRIR